MNENKKNSQDYWFPAKTYGYGWGFPTRREGWVVFSIYAVLMLIWPVIFNPVSHTLWFLIGFLTFTAALVAICYWKGEPALWRWGQGGIKEEDGFGPTRASRPKK